MKYNSYLPNLDRHGELIASKSRIRPNRRFKCDRPTDLNKPLTVEAVTSGLQIGVSLHQICKK